MLFCDKKQQQQKTLHKVGIEGNFLNVVKGIDEKSIDNNLGKRSNTFSPSLGKRQGYLFFLLFNIMLEVLAMPIRQEKEMKGLQIGKKEVKRSLFTDDKNLYRENPMNIQKIY